jgi:hypothetical protein
VLPILEVDYVNSKLPSLSAAITVQQLCATMSTLAFPSAADAARRLKEGFAAVRGQTSLEVEQKGKTKVFDPATSVPKDAVVAEGAQTLTIEFALRISPAGSLRPDALLAAVFSHIGIEPPDMVVVRTGLFIEDDEGNWSAPL